MENVRSFVPECVREFKVDWSKYSPAGGWEWQERFHSSVIPQLEKRIRELRSEVADTQRLISRASELRHAIDHARQTIEELSECGSTADSSDLRKWVEDAPAMLSRLSSYISDESNGYESCKDAEAEIFFLVALGDYFTRDLEFDMMMWALSEIPTKYRTRVFRIAARKFYDVVDAKNIVENASCPAAECYRSRFETPIRELGLGYAKMPLVIRATRKMIEKKGDLAWSDSNPLIAEQNRQYCVDACRAAKWETA